MAVSAAEKVRDRAMIFDMVIKTPHIHNNYFIKKT